MKSFIIKQVEFAIMVKFAIVLKELMFIKIYMMNL